MTRQPAWEYFSCPVRESLALRAGTSQLDDEEALVSPFSGLPGFDDCFAGTNLARIRAFFWFPTELRHIAYTTSSTRSLNARFPRSVYHRCHSPPTKQPVKSPHRYARTKSRETSPPNQPMEAHSRYTQHPLRRTPHSVK